LNTYPTGTYILNIVKGEEIIFTHKFQVVKWGKIIKRARNCPFYL
jgi:hypothetical protein